ncbi:MAG: HAMP domain-containing sensor histidine kinase [Elusimicrobiota bacterium]|nr:HAMP domain-containing sensor histidine kinase [Elusimicrobiota bacterium]
MTIRVKLALVLTVTVAASVAAATLGFVSLQRRALQRAEAEKEQLLLDGVRKTAAESLLAKDPLMLLSYLSALRKERPEVLSARVLLDGSWQAVGGPPAGEAADASPRRVEAALPGDDGRRASVELSLSTRLMAERERRAVEAAAAAAGRAAAVAVLLGALLSYPLSLTLTRRIVAIERALAEIGEGRYAEVGETGGSDELAALARNVDDMSRRLKELEEMKKLIVASVSHELRSPLGAIESKVRDLLAAPGVPEPARAGLESIRKSASRLEHFVSSMLEVARIERGRLEYAPRLSDLGAVVEDAVAFFAEKARDGGLTLDAAAAPGLAPFAFDPDLIAQVLANLVSNALKFTPKGGRVRVSAAVEGREAVVRVEDTGVGVPEEARARIFTPFERVPNKLRATGTGLGLSISKSIVERHGGRIGVSPRDGGGSVFYFALPLDRRQ